MGLLVRASPRLRFHADFWRGEWDGSTTLLKPITFDATPYAPEDRASVGVTINRLALFAGYEFPLGTPDEFELRIIPILGVHVLDARVALSNRTVGFTNQSRLRSIAPLAGALAQVNLGKRFTIEGRFWGMAASEVFQTEAAFMHISGEARWEIFKGFSVLAGWEYDKLEFDNSGAEDDSLMIDLHADGPYFGIGWKF